MRLLYIGQLWQGSTCLARMQTLGQLGLDLLPFNTTPFLQKGHRVERSLLSRFHIGRGIVQLNRRLQEISRTEYFDAIWIDKGVAVYPETLIALRTAARRKFAIHYTPDPQIVFHKSRHFLASIPIYDLLVTTKKFEMELYRRRGAQQVLLTLQGYSAHFAPMAAPSHADLASDVCFIGRFEKHYLQRVKAATSVAAEVKVWGPRWPRYTHFHPWAKRVVKGDGLWGAQYPRALASSKIALGLLSKWIPETTTTRTFEIPATGVFMLAERNEDHIALFEEGTEAEFFDNDDELRDKIRFYLRHESARARIAAAGRDRCVKSGYSIEHQLRCVLETVAKLLPGNNEYRI